MVILKIADTVQKIVPINGEVDLQAHLTDITGPVSLEVSGEHEVKIVDAGASFSDLSITLQSRQQAPLFYVLKTSSDDSSFSKISRDIVLACEQAGGVITVHCYRHTTQNQQVTIRTRQQHTASHTASEVVVHGVSEHRSRMNVECTIFIAKGLKGVTAHQIHKHLLLDNGARATSKPMLEVLSDDVSCSHGSAIAHITPLQLFYVQSRGHTDDAARKILLEAFLSPVVSEKIC